MCWRTCAFYSLVFFLCYIRSATASAPDPSGFHRLPCLLDVLSSVRIKLLVTLLLIDEKERSIAPPSTF
jgi:hypothetical protein